MIGLAEGIGFGLFSVVLGFAASICFNGLGIELSCRYK